MQITGALLVHADHAGRESEKIIALHAPAGELCRRCQLVWPCDAARLASETAELLNEVTALLLAPPAQPPTVVDVTADTPAIRAWRAARSAADAAYRRARAVLPGAEEGALPSVRQADLTAEQREALRELAAAESEQVRRALAMLAQAGAQP